MCSIVDAMVLVLVNLAHVRVMQYVKEMPISQICPSDCSTHACVARGLGPGRLPVGLCKPPYCAPFPDRRCRCRQTWGQSGCGTVREELPVPMASGQALK